MAHFAELDSNNVVLRVVVISNDDVDSNAQDYYIGLDDSADDLIIGLGSAVGTTPAIKIDENQDVTLPQDLNVSGARADRDWET